MALGAEFSLSDVFDIVPLPMWIVDAETLGFLAVNDAAVERYGYSREEFMAMTVFDVRPPAEQQRLREYLAKGTAEKALPAGGVWQHVTRDGTVHYVEIARAHPVTFQGRPAIVSAIVDVTERIQQLEQLRALLYSDPGTGLPNRAALLDKAQPAGRDANAVIMFRLAWVAGAYELSQERRVRGGLASLAALRRVVPKGADIVRYDTVSAAIVLRSDVRLQLVPLARRLIAAFARPVSYEGDEFLFIPTIGLSTASVERRPVAELVRQAEAALRDAERHGERVGRYSVELEQEHNRRATIARELRRAIRSGGLRIVYQPIVSLRSDRVEGAEALLRWNCPGIGEVPPAEFIPIAEETGWMPALGEWVLREACAQARRWQLQALPALRMSVNVSANEVEERDFVRLVTEICTSTNLSPSSLELELTERVMMDPDGVAIRNLAALRRLGVRIAVDDFGTGYSSLSYFADLPLDAVKLDRSFVARAIDEALGRKLVASIIDVAHFRGLTVVGEGVESDAELAALREAGCDAAQGYAIARPADPEEWKREPRLAAGFSSSP